MRTRALKDLRKVAVAFALLLIFGTDGWAQTNRFDEMVRSNAVGEAERGRGRGDQPAACRDTTPHKKRFVQVEPGVWLEVLDWGGEHKPQTMVLLTGLGDNAHVYDQFAQQFTDSFHVIGITRRGFFPSSQPRKGYDVETRARDDIAVLDALRISRATFVGHSLAGSELAKLGEVYGNRVDKLVFLDAADLADRFLPTRAEPPGQDALYTGAALKSLRAFQAASARYSALRKPDAAVCIDVVFGPKGGVRGFQNARLGRRQASAGRSRGREPTRQLGPRRGATAWHLCSVHTGGKTGLVLVPERCGAGRVRPGVATDRGLAQRHHRQVCERQSNAHDPAAWRAALCLHQQRDRGRSGNAQVSWTACRWELRSRNAGLGA